LPVVEHVLRAEQTATACCRDCSENASVDETHDICTTDIEQIGCLLRCELTIGTDDVHGRARRQRLQKRPHGAIGFGRKRCNLVTNLHVGRQLVEIERGDDIAVSAIEDERLGVQAHATSIDDSNASSMSISTFTNQTGADARTSATRLAT
jgi:hypothetical protein